MPSRDPRLVAGEKVNTKATNVISKPESQRLFGSAWKNRLVPGSVVQIATNTGGKIRKTIVVADWTLPSGNVVKPVLLRHVRAGTHLPQAPDGSFLHHGRDPAWDNGALSAAPSSAQSSSAESNRVSITVPLETQNTIQNAPSAFSFTIEANGKEWNVFDGHDDINGHINPRSWEVKAIDGSILSYGREWRERPMLEYFFIMFPMEHLTKIVSWTSQKLSTENETVTSAGEVLRFFGMLILITRFESGGSRRSLWKREPDCRYIPGPNFGAAMPRRRFDALFKNITF